MSATVVVATRDHASALADLFRACESACFCRYWHFDGDKNAWLERCALSPEKNEAEMRDDLARDAPRARGLVALDEARAVGWMKLAPRDALPKLRARRDLRALDLGDDDRVLSIGCMLVRPDARGRGVARDLVVAGVAHAERVRARAIEAYPHAARDLGPHEVWMGPCALFASLGFKHVTGDPIYPVMRLAL